VFGRVLIDQVDVSARKDIAADGQGAEVG